MPVNMTAYDREKWGVLITSPIMQTEMYACVRKQDHTAVSKDNKLTVITKKGFINDVMFVEDNCPNWNITSGDSTAECYRAIALKEADTALISSYRMIRT